MERNIEVELKFQVLDESQIKDFLKNLKFVGEKRIVDIYLDTKNGDLFKKGIFLRIRDNKKLDFKFNLADFQNQDSISRHEHSDEFSFSLPLSKDSIEKINNILRILKLKEITSPSLEELKTKNRLIDSMIIDKIRKIFYDGKFEYSLDEIKDLGKFIEIEFLAQEKDDLDRIKDEMRKKLEGLKLELITTGYCEVYWRKHDFNLYLQGRYLFQEDYEKYGLKGSKAKNG